MNNIVKNVLCMVICFIFDSVLTHFLPFDFAKSGWMMIPCVGLMMFSILCMYSKDSRKLAFATMVAAYYAILYADSLAFYVLIYGLITYYAKFYHYRVPESYLTDILFVVSTVFLQEIMIYLLMKGIGLTQLSMMRYMVYRMMPTLFLNLWLSLPVVYLYRRLMSKGEEHEY